MLTKGKKAEQNAGKRGCIKVKPKPSWACIGRIPPAPAAAHSVEEGPLLGLTVKKLRGVPAGHQPVPEEAHVVRALLQVVGRGPVQSQRETPRQRRLSGLPHQQLGYMVFL